MYAYTFTYIVKVFDILMKKIFLTNIKKWERKGTER